MYMDLDDFDKIVAAIPCSLGVADVHLLVHHISLLNHTMRSGVPRLAHNALSTKVFLSGSIHTYRPI
jgi:hypothetical protein